MSNRIIAIGDIHGCSTALRTLLDDISPQADDTLVILGDVVDRGPDSKSCVDQLLEIRDKCNFVLILGNHEEMLLQVVKEEKSPQEWLKHGGVSTLDSYGFAGDLSVVPQEHVDFFAKALPFFESDNHFFTHGNYNPKVALDQQEPMVLRWRSLIESTPGPHQNGKKAVLGHTPDKSGEIFDIGHLVCIDTYCYGGAWLSALDVESGKLWQANEEGELR